MNLEAAIRASMRQGATHRSEENYATVRVFRQRRGRWEQRPLCRTVEGAWVALGWSRLTGPLADCVDEYQIPLSEDPNREMGEGT